MPNTKNQTGLIVVKNSHFEKIRITLLKLIYGDDYEVIYKFENLIKTSRPKNIIIPKPISKKKL